MDREDQLIGEIISARSIAQMLAYALAQNGVLPRDEIETRLSKTIAGWVKRSNGEDPKKALQAGVAAVRLTEFLDEFRRLMGGTVQ